MKKAMYGFAVFLVLGAVIASGFVSAQMFGKWNSASNTDVQAAIDNNDYGAWKNAMANGLTEDRFNEILNRHQNMANGGFGRGYDENIMHASDFETYEEWQAYVATLDYVPRMASLTEDDFGLLKKMHQARIEGDFDKVQEIQSELGIGPFSKVNGKMQGKHGRFMN